MELMQEFVRDFAKQSKADSERIMQDAVTRILVTIISGMGQQAGGYVPVPAMMQMPGMNGVPAQPVALAEPVKDAMEDCWRIIGSCPISRYLMMPWHPYLLCFVMTRRIKI